MTIQRNVLGMRGISPLVSGGGGEVSRDTGFDGNSIIRLFRLRPRVIVGTSAIAIAIAVIYVLSLTPLYDASAEVMLDQRQNKVVDVDAVLSGLSTDVTSMENQLDILRSRDFMSQVVDRLDKSNALHTRGDTENAFAQYVDAFMYYLDPLDWFRSPPRAATGAEHARRHHEALIDKLLDGESVSQIGESSAMSVKYRSSDPQTAATVANAIADAYVEDQLKAKLEATEKTSQWLTSRLQQLSSQMQAADAAVLEYKAENNIEETPTGSPIADQQIADLSNQLVVARSDLATAEAKYAHVHTLEASGKAEDVAQIFQSGMIEHLRQQEADLLRQKAALATTLGPRHPRMLDIESELRNNDAKINQEVSRVVETVANDVIVARAHVQSLGDSLTQIESQSAVQNRASVKLVELKAKSASAHQLYEACLSKLKEIQGQEDIQSPDAKVISSAIVPTVPAVPYRTRYMELAVIGGAALGFFLAYLLEGLHSGFRTALQLEQMLGAPVLATLPEVRALNGSSAANLIVNRPMSSFADAVRGLYMSLILSNLDHKPKVILVTSSGPNEGKTTLALGLARTIARDGQRVTLLDGDFRRPNLVEALNLAGEQDGLIEVLLGKTPLDRCLIQDPLSDVLLLPTSRITANMPDLAGSAAMEKVISTLKTACDFVIIDAAPLLPVNDTKALAQLADAAVFVVRWEKTPQVAVARAARALTDIDAQVVGTVFTRADIGRFSVYNYGLWNDRRYRSYYTA